MADQVTNLSALTWSALVIALVWVMLCIAGAAGVVTYRRMVIMYTCGYGWKDAGVLLRRRSKRALHAKLNAERAEPVRAQAVPLRPEGPGHTELASAVSDLGRAVQAGVYGTEPADPSPETLRARPVRAQVVPIEEDVPLRLSEGELADLAARYPAEEGPGYTAVIEAIGTPPATITRAPGGTEQLPTITMGRADGDGG